MTENNNSNDYITDIVNGLTFNSKETETKQEQETVVEEEQETKQEQETIVEEKTEPVAEKEQEQKENDDDEEDDELGNFKFTEEEAKTLLTHEEINNALTRRVAQIRNDRLEKRVQERLDAELTPHLAAIDDYKSKLDEANEKLSEAQLSVIVKEYNLDEEATSAITDTGLKGDALIEYAKKHAPRLASKKTSVDVDSFFSTVKSNPTTKTSKDDFVSQILSGVKYS